MAVKKKPETFAVGQRVRYAKGRGERFGVITGFRIATLVEEDTKKKIVRAVSKLSIAK